MIRPKPQQPERMKTSDTETDELGFTYAAAARIMDARGFSLAEIEAFLTQHQNPAGYIRHSLIPNKPNR